MDEQCLNNIKAEEPPNNIPCSESFCAENSQTRKEFCEKAGLPSYDPVRGFDPETSSYCYCCCPPLSCIDNIRKLPPPNNVPCTEAYCKTISSFLDQHCKSNALPPCTPMITFDSSTENLCYCCCPCPSPGTPVAVTNIEFDLAQNLKQGDTVWTTGPELKWRPGKIEFISEPINSSMISELYFLQFEIKEANPQRNLIVSKGHLFMTPGDKSLKKVQDLIPGEELLSADGNLAKVINVALGVFEFSIRSIELEGDFNGENLDGHLINTNGLISADFKVQAFYAAKEF